MNKKIATKFRKTPRGPWNYFHNCHICQGMKQGRGQTEEDLKQLFKEAEKTELKNAEV
jgi:hypothetical protein